MGPSYFDNIGKGFCFRINSVAQTFETREEAVMAQYRLENSPNCAGSVLPTVVPMERQWLQDYPFRCVCQSSRKFRFKPSQR
jgi:hypothetical protein